MVASYIDYFRQLAVNHPSLLHNIATENGGDGNKAFARFSPDEVVTGLRSQINESALLIELYEIELTNNSYSPLAKHSGAFSIIKRGEPNNFQKEEQCFTDAETILNDILQSIWDDHYGSNKDRCQTPFFLFDFAGISIMPVGPIFNHYFGYRCEFSFRPKAPPITIP